MTRIQYAARIGAAALLVSASTACSSALGNVFGNVLGGGSQDMSGTVQGVDTRSQQIFMQQSNGQTIGIGYDSRTQVVYQNQTYSVNSLERGDQITVRLNNATASADLSFPVGGSCLHERPHPEGQLKEAALARRLSSVNAVVRTIRSTSL